LSKKLQKKSSTLIFLKDGTVERRDRYGIMKKKKKREL
jgi:hypothetical protein